MEILRDSEKGLEAGGDLEKVEDTGNEIFKNSALEREFNLTEGSGERMAGSWRKNGILGFLVRETGTKLSI